MKKSKRTWLWSIDRDDLKGTCYLFGTVHLRSQSVFGFLDLALNRLANCEAVAVEFDLDTMQENTSASSLDTPDGFHLSKMLKQKQLIRLERIWLEQTGMPIQGFLNMHPFVLISILAQAISTKEMSKSLDETIWSEAKEQGKTLFGLETYEAQLEIISKMDFEKQIKQLKDLIRNFKRYRKSQDKMIGWYEKADLAKLNKAALRQAGSFKKLLVYNRNQNMAEEFLNIAGSVSLFAAVGAGHLPGQKGMLKILKKMGCKVKPITQEAG